MAISLVGWLSVSPAEPAARVIGYITFKKRDMNVPAIKPTNSVSFLVEV